MSIYQLNYEFVFCLNKSFSIHVSKGALDLNCMNMTLRTRINQISVYTKHADLTQFEIFKNSSHVFLLVLFFG